MDDVRYQNPLSKRFLEVGAAAGLGTNDDFNNWSRPQDGVGRFQVSQSGGERCSGATAFLKGALRRKNLKVRTGTMVRRINFDSSKTATGVTYDLVGDDTCTVRSMVPQPLGVLEYYLLQFPHFVLLYLFRASLHLSLLEAKFSSHLELLHHPNYLCAVVLAHQNISRSMAFLLSMTIQV